jgi:hypothetical protein
MENNQNLIDKCVNEPDTSLFVSKRHFPHSEISSFVFQVSIAFGDQKRSLPVVNANCFACNGKQVNTLLICKVFLLNYR